MTTKNKQSTQKNPFIMIENVNTETQENLDLNNHNLNEEEQESSVLDSIMAQIANDPAGMQGYIVDRMRQAHAEHYRELTPEEMKALGMRELFNRLIDKNHPQHKEALKTVSHEVTADNGNPDNTEMTPLRKQQIFLEETVVHHKKMKAILKGMCKKDWFSFTHGYYKSIRILKFCFDICHPKVKQYRAAGWTQPQEATPPASDD